MAAVDRVGPFQHLYVAFSGGVDSHVLLHLCAGVADWEGRVTAVYVHHGLQAVADDWSVHCAQVAQQCKVAFRECKVNAQAQAGESPEEAARNARYHALAAVLGTGDIMLFAQHRDDQLETVLLQLFRGAGLQGLAGMPEIAALGAGKMLRPLLAYTRAQILDYAGQQHLQWVEDPSNQEDAFDRNFLRLQILPLLQTRWPSLASTVSRSARLCAQAQEALQQHALKHLPLLTVPQLHMLDLTVLQGFALYEQQQLLRAWCAELSLRMPSETWLNHLMGQVIHAKAARDPILRYGSYQFRRYRQHLYCLPLQLTEGVPSNLSLHWPKEQQHLHVHAYSQLSLCPTSQGIAREQWQKAVVTVTLRQGGEKISLPGRSGRHCLKKLCQEAGIPPWQRAALPLIYMDGILVAVADLWLSSEVFQPNRPDCIRFIWQYGLGDA